MTARARGSRGGQGGWEPRARVQGRERRVVDLATVGWSQHAIAAELQISQAAVSKILARVDARTLRELTTSMERQKVRQTQRLEFVYAEAMRAWRESQADTTRRRQRQVDGSRGPGQTVAEVVVTSQHGDPRYLETARKALTDLRRLWGMDAPQRVDVQALQPYADLSEPELLALLAQQEALLLPPAPAGEPAAAVRSDTVADAAD